MGRGPGESDELALEQSAMPVERRFLGWDAPVTIKVRDFLLGEASAATVDLSKELIVAPTRHAGRRLRESLAVRGPGQQAVLLSPRVVTPAFFLRSDETATSAASPTEVIAVWADVLAHIDPGQLRGLFPAGVPRQDFLWAMRTGETIQNLRDTLADGGYRIADVVQAFGPELEEIDRWQDLATLEAEYLERLGELARKDPCDLMIRRADNPEVPAKIRRLVIASVPDPTPLMVRALERLSEQVPILILVHAPEQLSDHFDAWGQPIPEKWRDSAIDIPDSDSNLILAGSPGSQSRKVLDIVASETDRFGPADIAIGVADDAITAHLTADLGEKSLHTFDPSGKYAREHPVYYVLQSYRSLVIDSSYAALGAILRHPDMLTFLEARLEIPVLEALTEFDTFQNQHLPTGFEDVMDRLNDGAVRQDFGHLEKVVLFAAEQQALFRTSTVAGAVRSFLQSVYRVRMIHPGDAEDDAFIAVAGLVDEALREVDGECVGSLKIERSDALGLLLGRLGAMRYYPEGHDAIIDLEGWLELPWNDAPFLIVTGMNEGSVPSGRVDDVFLPDSLRTRLGLRNDAARLATDALAMRTLIESRREGGRVCFLVGKTSAAGDPLKPSRLLFRCADDQLPARASRLFGDPDERRDNCPATISFRLEVSPPSDLRSPGLNLNRLAVTAFRDYLACPFRFYLKRILGMEPLADEKTEMDSLDFGSLVHHALHRMARDPGMSSCTDEHRLSRFLQLQAEDWVRERFGTFAPLSVQIQLDSAVQRLAAMARTQVQLISEGWRTVHSEVGVKGLIHGIEVSGRIDRIDRHGESGTLRILDYKTSDKAATPDASHLGSGAGGGPGFARIVIGKKEKRWVDLQLPLYAMILPDTEAFRGDVELGYFNLPKATSQTEVVIWSDFSAEMLRSARDCAEHVIDAIKAGQFWPPASKVQFDDFEDMFHSDVSECVDVESFMDSLKKVDS